MPKSYKVWVQVEHYDDESGNSEDIGLPDPIGAFDKLEDAQAIVRQILTAYNPDELEHSDHKAPENKGGER